VRVQAASSVVAIAAVLGCGAGGAATDSRFPSRPEGCAVRLFHETPDVPTTNIGPVRAHCGLDVADTDCLRTLEDQVCKLGGDVVWGVADKPSVDGDKNFWQGRAAHTGSFSR
jgi:hypothetical protein